jgi:molecular chaperone GrpE (heat shock protein)
MKAICNDDNYVGVHVGSVYFLALLVAFLPFLTGVENCFDPFWLAWLKIACAVLAVFIAMVPSIYAFRINTGRSWSRVMSDINTTMADVLSIRKEYKLTQVQVQQLQTNIGEGVNALQAFIRSMQDDQKHMREEIAQVSKLTGEIDYLRKQVSVLTRGQGDWIRHCLRFVETLDRLADDPGLSSDYRESLVKSLCDFGRVFEAQGIHIVVPREGQAFDDKLHEQVDIQQSEIVEPGYIAKTKERGMMAGEIVIKKAKVVIAEKPTSKEETQCIESKPQEQGQQQ